jgi:hypothetical protein
MLRSVRLIELTKSSLCYILFYYIIFSQRAFGLDSRTVWVEQQMVRSVCLPKENLPLGPGEYNPKNPTFDRNISTPFVGKRELFPSDYKPFMSSVWSAEVSEGGRHQSGRHGDKGKSLGGSRSDHRTVFHDNDMRQPLDPNQRFCETPGPTLGHGHILDSTNKSDGRYKAHTIHLDKNKSARFTDPEPVNEYDPQYGSKHLVRRTKEQFVPKVGHLNPFPASEDDYRPHMGKGGPMAAETEPDNNYKATKWDQPKHKLKFDSSCYARKEVPDIIRPSEINRRVKKDQFFRMLTTRIDYDSKSIGTSVDTRRFRGDI